MRTNCTQILIPILFLLNLSLSAQTTKACILHASDFLASNNGDHTQTLKNVIQKAFEEGCTLIIDSPNQNNLESWIIKEVFIEGEKFNQIPGVEIIFEASVKAQSDFFSFNNGLRDAPPSMFVFEECNNFSIKGKGSSVISMNGLGNQTGLDDYVRTSEWYHAFKMLSCDNVLMEGLIIDGTGGDGIYIDSKRYHNGVKLCDVSGFHPINFTVKNCFIDKAWRNGLAIGSGENIIIEGCTISRTKGAAPQAGIDIEIEQCGAILKNLIIKNNTLYNNFSYGVECSFSVTPADNEINVQFIDNEIIGGKGYAMDTRNRNYLNGKVQFHGGTIDIVDKEKVAPLGFLLSAPKPTYTGNNLQYDLGNSIVIYNSAKNKHFVGFRVKSKEVILFNCLESNPCRKGTETSWNFFGGVNIEKIHIWDNHEKEERRNKAVQISRGGMECVNPRDIKIHATKRNNYCQCGEDFNLQSSFFKEDNCNVCGSGPENRDNECLEENSLLQKRTYSAKSEICDIDIKLEVIGTKTETLPTIDFYSKNLKIDQNQKIHITVCRDKNETYPISVKLDWSKSLEVMRKYFFQYPQFIQIPIGQICKTRILDLRPETKLEDLREISLKFSDSEYYKFSKRELNIEENNGPNNFQSVNYTTTFTETIDTINYNFECLREGITFNSQNQLDSFKVLFPNCTEILGKVRIKYDSKDPIRDFTALNNIEKVKGLYFNYGVYKNLKGLENLKLIENVLWFQNADSLVSFDGLNGLEKVGSLMLNRLNISNLEGLGNLKIIEHNFSVFQNNSLETFNGLNSIKQIGEVPQEGFLNNIVFSQNPILSSINSLNNIGSEFGHLKGNLKISENHSLSNLNGLNKINKVDGLLEINKNETLNSLSGIDEIFKTKRLHLISNRNLQSLEALQNLRTIQFGLEISDNKSLEGISALQNIDTLGSITIEDDLPYLKISNNLRLTSISPLKKAFECQSDFKGKIILQNNPRIINLNGLEDLRSAYEMEILKLGIKNFKELSNLHHLSNSLKIDSNFVLQTLNGLEHLGELGAKTKEKSTTLSIDGNPNLKSLKQLKNLKAKGDLFSGSLEIIGNNLLTNLQGLEGLDSIGWDLIIADNQNLKTFDGLENVSYVRANNKISNNRALTNLDALSNLKESDPYHTTTFELSNHPFLTNMHGLRNFRFSQIEKLRFFNNQLIDICDYPELCFFLKIPEIKYDIFGNGKNCEFIDDIRNGCAQSTSSLQNADIQSIINIYPNPTDGKIYLSGFDLNNAKATIYDPSGRILKHHTLNGTNSIDLPTKLKGLFFIKIETETIVETHKILKH